MAWPDDHLSGAAPRSQRAIRRSRTSGGPLGGSRRADDRGRRPPTEASTPEQPPAQLVDRGLILLLVFTASALIIVALVVLVGAIGRWWTLIPVMAVDFTVTAAVLVTVAKLLEDANS